MSERRTILCLAWAESLQSRTALIVTLRSSWYLTQALVVAGIFSVELGPVSE